MNQIPIVLDQTYPVPAAVVWKAITDKDQMREWFFEPIADFEPSVGFETVFDVQCEGRNFPHRWKVIEVVPLRRIVYQWSYDGIAGESTVAWDLAETGGGTTLTLTHAGIESFPQNDPMFSRESGEAGWGYFLNESLRSFLSPTDA